MTKRDSHTRTPRVLALLTAALILGTSTSPAVAQSLAETRSLSLDSIDVSTPGPLLLHARRLASNLSQAPTNDSSTQGKGARTPNEPFRHRPPFGGHDDATTSRLFLHAKKS